MIIAMICHPKQASFCAARDLGEARRAPIRVSESDGGRRRVCDRFPAYLHHLRWTDAEQRS
jgi:hypothetical protein